MGGGGGACVGSGGVSERDCCRLPGVIQELWEDLPYSFPFFLEFFSMREGAKIDYVSWVKSQRSMSSISSLVLTSISYINMQRKFSNPIKGNEVKTKWKWGWETE